jgi:hypothetical protein
MPVEIQRYRKSHAQSVPTPFYAHSEKQIMLTCGIPKNDVHKIYDTAYVVSVMLPMGLRQGHSALFLEFLDRRANIRQYEKMGKLR